ncbi:patatin-like phospholipase family protein [Actinomycetospora endophytica]|uniref:Patatin-like phospholipase family protein n=1 Tax=Actinomycetospora endophytica TaxID=2291215 RepID=A0ABS8PF39_9PSEU|nr:patatin-like phospholipase family protein [Actinomycetospora endophytica]MCD2196130.1 patatin-like phospholipase family protein [Actinomycetospora endophytica]
MRAPAAGAIVAALVAAYQRAGKDLHELEDEMRRVQYSKFAEGSLLQRLTGPVGDGLELLLHEGAHSGDYLVEWLEPLLASAGVRTFADLARHDPHDSLGPDERYSLVVHVSDLSRRALVRLPWDYREYGKEPGDQKVVDAVRASMSIPFYFRPVEVTTASGQVTWVDGGLLSNFPITVFDRTDGGTPRWPTWGVKLSARPTTTADEPVRTTLGLAVRALQTLTADWNRYRLAEEGVGRRTVFVDTSGISATDFDLTQDDQNTLFQNGRTAAARFLRQIERTSATTQRSTRGEP